MGAEEISLHATPPRTVKVRARGEDFRIVQLVGNLQSSSCDAGRIPITADRRAAGQASFKLQWP